MICDFLHPKGAAALLQEYQATAALARDFLCGLAFPRPHGAANRLRVGIAWLSLPAPWHAFAVAPSFPPPYVALRGSHPAVVGAFVVWLPFFPCGTVLSQPYLAFGHVPSQACPLTFLPPASGVVLCIPVPRPPVHASFSPSQQPLLPFPAASALSDPQDPVHYARLRPPALAAPYLAEPAMPGHTCLQLHCASCSHSSSYPCARLRLWTPAAAT
mmetsp:Transcript_81035/g.135579  ORF Transcript_81035/g.135579 Transcript_81035/m.135579 type:complete len:215 (-) Transcript_81035:1272-1916(-)